jgi:hypothetical protein
VTSRSLARVAGNGRLDNQGFYVVSLMIGRAGIPTSFCITSYHQHIENDPILQGTGVASASAKVMRFRIQKVAPVFPRTPPRFDRSAGCSATTNSDHREAIVTLRAFQAHSP